MALVLQAYEIGPDEYEVLLELWPFGSKMNKQLLGIGLIANDGTASDGSGDSAVGNYIYHFRGKDGAKLRNGDGRIVGYKRKRKHPWNLVKVVLDDMYGSTK